MARNLRKFVNPKFTRTIDLALLRRLLERHRDGMRGFDLGVFDREAEEARQAVQNFFAGPEDAYPEGLVADLHRIAELGNANGLRLLQEQAVRHRVVIGPERDENGTELRQDPKHVALRVFLDHPRLFNAASDILALTARTSLAEFAGVEEGIDLQIDDTAKQSFEDEVARMFEADLRGRYCRIGWYDDDDEVNLVVTHGAPLTTTDVVDQDKERVISFRTAEHAVLSYSSAAGRLKIGGVPKARRAELAEIFALTMLKRPRFFAAPDAQDLYTLRPVERAGFSFSFNHDFDPGIRRVQIIEAQANRVSTDPQTGEERVWWSIIARDSRDSALARLGGANLGGVFGDNAWRLNHLMIRVHIDVGERQPARVTAKIKPPATVMFKRQRFEGRIMELLRRNGLCNEREPRDAAAAAE